MIVIGFLENLAKNGLEWLMFFPGFEYGNGTREIIQSSDGYIECYGTYIFWGMAANIVRDMPPKIQIAWLFRALRV